MRASTFIPLALAAAFTTACAHTTGATSGRDRSPAAPRHLRQPPRGAQAEQDPQPTEQPTERRPELRRSFNLISFTEIASLRGKAYVPTAYDLVERMRPAYLNARVRSLRGAEGPLVFVDNLFLGGIATLRQIDSRTVQEIRYVHGDEMISRIGRAVNGRVIHVVTVR